MALTTSGQGGSQFQLPRMQIHVKGHQDTVNCLAVREAKSQLFSGSNDGTMKIWSWANGFELAHTLSVGAPVEALLLSEAANRLAQLEQKAYTLEAEANKLRTHSTAQRQQLNNLMTKLVQATEEEQNTF